jgi:L-fuculose-phosphate aldolase
MLDAECRQIVEACQRLATDGLVIGTAGNVSARAGDLVAITPTGGVLAELEPEHMSIIDMQGNLVSGELEPTSEVLLHLAVYRTYAAGAVVHHHAPMATALSCVLDELPCIHYQMLGLGGSVRVAPYATFGSQELADVVVTALEGRNAALMSNHGATTYAADMSAALERSTLLEWACNVYWRASMLGTPRVLSVEQQEAVIASAITRGYGRMRAAGPARGVPAEQA